MIEVNGLVKKYGNHMAVDHLSFNVQKGQILGFLGPNGAGKSTTMNMVTGYISATEGEIIINGYDMYEEPEEAKQQIGYLPEIPPLYPDMTVLEYLKFAAELKKVPKTTRSTMLKDVMEQTKITDVSKRLIKQLSKGYKQRVGLAQAIIGYPEVIILDEPTVGLDPMQIIEIRDLMKELAKNHTVIISSHILSEIRAICDTIMIINKGKLVIRDTTERLTEHFKGNNHLVLEVKAEESAIRQVLADIPQIQEIICEQGTETKLCKVSLTIKNDCDIREQIFYIMAEKQYPIYTMAVQKTSLEDIFLEMTKEEETEFLKRTEENLPIKKNLQAEENLEAEKNLQVKENLQVEENLQANEKIESKDFLEKKEMEESGHESNL